MDQFKKPHGKNIYLTSRAQAGFSTNIESATELKAGESIVRKYQGPNRDNDAALTDDQVGLRAAYQRMLPGGQEDDITGNVAFVELLYLARTDYT